MKIAMLSFRLPAPGSRRGGVERVAHHLANVLARRGHQVTVWSADEAPSDAHYRVAKLPFARFLHNGFVFRSISGYLGNLLALICPYGDPDVLIAHGDSLLLPLRRIPLLRVMHGSAWDEARTARSTLRRAAQFGVFVQEHITVRTQRTVAISRATQARYSAIRDCIPNGVDTRQFFPGTWKCRQPAVLFVGTLGGRKRGDLLIEWFQTSIRPAVPDCRLWMVSETGPPCDGVEYFTAIDSDALAELYRRAWIVASPSAYEGFGLPYLEAMASGTPVIATVNAGSMEVLDGGRYGVLIRDDAEFAPAVVRALRHPESLEKWAERGLERAFGWSLDTIAESYESLLESVVSGHRPAEVRA